MQQNPNQRRNTQHFGFEMTIEEKLINRAAEKSDGVIVRPAERSEAKDLADVFADVSMDADLRLSVERHPDFFYFYDLAYEKKYQGVRALEKNGKVEGTAAFLGRECYLGKERIRTVYMSDLRFRSTIRGGQILGQAFSNDIRIMRERLDAELMYTVLFDKNAAAQKALVARDPRWPQKPLYRPIRKFTITSILLAHPRPRRKTKYTISRGTKESMDEVLAFLQDDQKTRPFGYILDEGEFEKRITKWPRFGPEQFYLARNSNGKLAGVVATWDAVDAKRYRVLEYRGSMKKIKRVYNTAAKLAGGTPLPQPGELLRYVYLTHLCIPNEDPNVFAALLDEIYGELRGTGMCSITAYLEKDDPLKPALRGYLTSGIDATLFSVCPPQSRFASMDLSYSRPGFEMALA